MDESHAAQERLDHHYLQTSYEQDLSAVYSWIYARVGNRDEAEELTTKVFLAAARERENFSASTSILDWLLQLARIIVADRDHSFYALLMQQPHSQMPARVGDERVHGVNRGQVSQGDQLPTRNRVQWILAHLQPEHREVVICRFLLNLSLEQTAARMQLDTRRVLALQYEALQLAGRLMCDAGVEWLPTPKGSPP